MRDADDGHDGRYQEIVEGEMMGKMSKKNLDALKREDPKENNWEIPENAECGDSPMKGQSPEKSPDAVLKQQYPDELAEVFSKIEDAALKERLHKAWLRVDPEIRAGNPVWMYSVKGGKHFVFLFQSGQKVRVEL